MLRVVRRMRGLTHEQLAARAGVARGFVESKSSGQAAIDLKDIEILAPALEVDDIVFLMEPERAQLWVAEQNVAAVNGGATSTKWYKGERSHLRLVG